MSELIEPGQPAPDFALSDQGGQTHRLSDHLGQWVVLYFYPRDNTPGCTKEACQFRDAKPDWSKANVQVFGISPQGVKSKARFAEKHALNHPVLADEDQTICETYGVWQTKKLYGKSFLGVVRTTYVIAPDGTVAKRFDKVKVKDHAETVLQAINEL